MPSARNEPEGPTEVVAIDGPSGAGKSTVARALARRLGFAYLDTGAMYRAVTWHFLEEQCAPNQQGGDPEGERCMREVLLRTELRLLPEGRVLVNGRDVTSHLRSREVESQVSAVSALPFVRQAMRELQRRVAAEGPVVAEGRDMGSVVFPRARWKVFLDAQPGERARRRHKDFADRGRPVSEREVLEEMQVRDQLDSTRRDAPLLRAEDAHYIDSTGVEAEPIVEAILAWMGRSDR
jgi:cytidylate kinase